MKKIFSLFAAVLFAGSMAATEVKLTNANIKDAGDGANGYQAWEITDDASRTWNAYAIKNKHSNATAQYHYLQIKKYASDVAYYIEIPELGEAIQSITMTVSSTQKAMDGGGNNATLFFSASNATSAAGTDVASGTGASSVTIDASELGLTSGFITAGAAVRIWDITIITGGAPVGVAKPTIAGDACFQNEVEVALDCKTEGAKIYYTLDGSEPTASSTAYSAAFKLTASATVKAIAINGDDKSDIAEKAFTAYPTSFNCADAAAAALSVSADKDLYACGLEFSVKGYVTSIETDYSDTYHNISFWIADAADGGNVLEAFRAACASEAAAPKVGNYVEVTGQLTKYGTTPEFAAGCTFSIKETPTALDNTNAAVKVEKFFRDGQLIIRKNGVEYNATGAIIK